MEPWERWMAMARESLAAAQAAESGQFWRPCISRYYYAAYQAATAVLLYRKQRPPEGREGWSHEATPELLQEHLKPVIIDRGRRNDLAARLGRLYKLRIEADYLPSKRLPRDNVDSARRDAGYLV